MVLLLLSLRVRLLTLGHWHLHHDQDLPQGSGKVDLESFRHTSPRRVLGFGETKPAMDPQYIARQNNLATDTYWGAAASVTPRQRGPYFVNELCAASHH